MFFGRFSLCILVCFVSFLSLASAQQPATQAQQQTQAAQAVVAEPEAPRLVLQGETTASVLRLMKFSGLLRDHAGNARTGAVGLAFALYKDQQGGSPLWLEAHNAQLDEQGRYTVLLGSTRNEGLPLELFSTGEARWLGVQVNLPGEEEQARVVLVAVPYALKAADAETLGGKPPSAFLLAETQPAQSRPSTQTQAGVSAAALSPIKGEGAANFLAKFVSNDTIGNAGIFELLGNVGIGTTTPNTRLSVGAGSIPDGNVPVQISTGGPGTVAYYGANKGGGYGALFGYETGGFLGTGGVMRVVTTDPLMFFVKNTTEAMRITSTGNVGMGTTTPSEKLEVAGNVKVSGGGKGVIFPDGTMQTTAGVAPGTAMNPLQVALLRWYPVIETGLKFSVGNSPFGLTFDGTHIWVASALAGEVTKLRASDGARIGTFRLTGASPFELAFDGANIWFSNVAGDTVTKLRASDGAHLGTFGVGGSPGGVAFDGANIWVANRVSNTVTKLRASDGANLGTFAVGSFPQGVAFDGANIWVTNRDSNTVTKLRASDGANLGTFAVGSLPQGVAFDGANMWATSQTGVTKLQAIDGLNLGSFPAGNRGVAFDGTNIWVAGGGRLTKLRVSDGANVGTFTVGSDFWGVAFDGANIWVSDQGQLAQAVFKL